jgi:hypothetical protein
VVIAVLEAVVSPVCAATVNANPGTATLPSTVIAGMVAVLTVKEGTVKLAPAKVWV